MIKIIKKIVNKIKRLIRNHDKSMIDVMKGLTQEQKDSMYAKYMHQDII